MSALCTRRRSWPFFTVVAEARANFDDASGSDGDYRDGARNVGVDDAGDRESCDAALYSAAEARETALGVINLDDARVAFVIPTCAGGGAFGRGVL